MHVVPGRVRVSLPGWSGREGRALEAQLRVLRGVRSAQANSVTGNAVLRFDPALTNPEALRLAVRQIVRALPSHTLSSSGRTEPPAPGQADPAPPHVVRERPSVQSLSDGSSANGSSANGMGAKGTGASSSAPANSRARVEHSVWGRARVSVRGLDRDPALARRVEEALERNGDVKARANPLTGRVLVEFNAHRVELEELIAQVADIELPPLPDEPRPAYPLDPAPLLQSATRTVGAGLGLGVLAARHVADQQILPGAGTASQVSSVIGIVQGFPPLRNGARRLLGMHVADLLFNGANIISLVFAGNPLGLSVSVLESSGLMAETLARRASWKRYRSQIEALPPVREGEDLRLEAGERAPLGGVVQEGSGNVIGRDGLPHPLATGERVRAGERVQGGPFVIRAEAGAQFEPQPRPAPPREAPETRYARLLGPISLGYALFTGVVTRSFGRGFESLLLVNPRASVIGTEFANTSASTRVLRAGVTVVGTRLGRPIRRFDWLLLDGSRLLCEGIEISRTVPLDGIADTSELLSLAAGVSAAAGLPWGGVFPSANRAPAQEGAFDGHLASALVGGTRYTVHALRPDEEVPGHKRSAGELILVLGSERENKYLAMFALRPRVAGGVRGLVQSAKQARTRIAIVGDDEATRAFAHRAGVEVVPTPNALEAIRSRQGTGEYVAFVSDSAEAAEAFAACDLAIGLTSGRSHFRARADVLSPDVGGLAAIIEAGARRDVASRDGLVFSLIANGVGLFWGWQGGTGVARASRAVYVAALAALGSAWWRERGGARPHATASRVVDPRPEKWGARSIEEVVRSLDSTPQGLTQQKAQDRLKTLPPPIQAEKHGLAEALWLQFRLPINVVLLGGGALSFLFGSYTDVALIAGTIVLNAIVGAWQEGQADKAAQALETMGSPQVCVLRDGEPQVLASRELVPGDVMVLASGDRVAADARVLEASSLEVDEAALTGESLPVVKSPEGGEEASRIVLEGSDVTTGSGRALVVAVGRGTRMGATAASLASETRAPSPLDHKLNGVLGRSLPWSLGAGALVAASAVLRGAPIASQAALGASVAVSAVPEGLPLLAKMGEAAVARRLATRGALVRRLTSVEALGRVDVACTDKTGTLTQGRLSLRVVADLDSQSELPAPQEGEALIEIDDTMRLVLRCAGLASPHPDAPDAASHPTDVSVVRGAERIGLGSEMRQEREAESPFDPVRAFHAAQVGGSVCVKGATEAILPRCSFVRRDGQTVPVDEALREELSQRAIALSQQGLRVLMVAQAEQVLEDQSDESAVTDPRELTALGFIGISDPLRPKVQEAVSRCHSAGIRVIMLTGDHPATARAIAAQAGLFLWPDKSEQSEEGRVLTGSQLSELVNGELDSALERAVVVARATPLDKVRIVESLQRRGHIVAMTGDGVNDAPALRLADAGVAMGKGGTEVARQAADVVLAEDDFSTLVEALVEGRSFWRNVRRALGLLIGGNAGEVGLQVGAGLLGMVPPLTTTQVLAVNMITDVLPAIAVALQQPENRDLSALAREGTQAMDKPLQQDILRRGSAVAIPSLLGYILGTALGGEAQGRSAAFIGVIVTQMAQTLDAGRSEGGLSRPVLGAVAGSLGLLGTALAIPTLRDLFGLVIPTPLVWALIAAEAGLAVTMSRTLPLPGTRPDPVAPPKPAPRALDVPPKPRALPGPSLAPLLA